MSDSLQYVGNCEFEEVEDFKLRRDDWGMDVLERTYGGRRDKLAEFLKSLKPRVADVEFPEFALTDLAAGPDRGAFAVVVATFAGLIGDDIPEPEVEGGYDEESVQVSVTEAYGSFAEFGAFDLSLGNNGGGIGAEGINLQALPYFAQEQEQLLISLAQLADNEESQVTITYNAPTTTYLYVTRKEPKAPRYPTKLLLSEGDFEISDLRPATFTGRPIVSREIKTKSFKKKRKGNFWEVSEVTQGKLVSLKIAMRGFTGKFEVTGNKKLLK